MNLHLAIVFVALCCASLAAKKPAAASPVQTSPGKSYIYKTSADKPREMEIYFPPNHDPARAKVPGMILDEGVRRASAIPGTRTRCWSFE